MTHSLRKDLRVITLGNLSDLILGSGRIDNPVLSLHPVFDLFPELLLDNLVLLEQGGEAGLDSFDLVLHRPVTFGELEKMFDLVFALFTSSPGLVVELISVACRSGIGRCLESGLCCKGECDIPRIAGERT